MAIAITGGVGYSASTLIARSPTPATGLVASAEVALRSPEDKLRLCYDREKNTSTKTCVVDGDTLWLHGTDYRLKDVDTPETHTNICGGASEIALGQKAAERLLNLLNSNPWTIETFGVDGTGRRTLATIRVGGRDVGDILIAEHLARRWPDGAEFWCRR